MVWKIVLLVLIGVLPHCQGRQVPKSVKELQKYYGDGTGDDYTNAFYKYLKSAKGLGNQATKVLKKHLKGPMYGFTDDHINMFVRNMKLISETVVKTDSDLKLLKNRLYHPDDFMTDVLMDQLLFNRDDADEARQAFDHVFLKKNANSVVQLYFVEDEDIFSGVIVAAKRKKSPHAVHLVFVID